jgi:hypothetical protein
LASGLQPADKGWLVQYQTDYIMRLVEQLGSVIRKTVERLGLRQAEEPVTLASEAIGLALDMDPETASELTPQSLVSLLELRGLDRRVVELVHQAIEIEAVALEDRGEVVAAMFRREQADALQSLLDRTLAMDS